MTKTLFGHKIESSWGRFLRLRRWEQRTEVIVVTGVSSCYWGLGTADVEWHGGCGVWPRLVVTIMLWSCFGHSEAQWRESPIHVILCQLPWEMIFDFQIQIGKLLTDWETGPSSKTAAPSARVAALSSESPGFVWTRIVRRRWQLTRPGPRPWSRPLAWWSLWINWWEQSFIYKSSVFAQ